MSLTGGDISEIGFDKVEGRNPEMFPESTVNLLLFLFVRKPPYSIFLYSEIGVCCFNFFRQYAPVKPKQCFYLYCLLIVLVAFVK